MEAKPTVGRIVHYSLPIGSRFKGQMRAAIITLVHSDAEVNLTVFKGQPEDLDTGLRGGNTLLNPTASPTALVARVLHDPSGKPGTWNWPARPEAANPERK